MRAFLVILVINLLVACSKEIPLPHAKSLNLNEVAKSNFYGMTAGNYNVVELNKLNFNHAGKDIDYRILYPESDDTVPLIVFSHGFWSTNEKYDALLKHWVSHGYAVIAPNHLDCCSMAQGIWYSLIEGQLGLIKSRPEDVIFLIDNIKDILKQNNLTQRINTERVALSGHSFGAFTAQMLAGAEAIEPDTQQRHGSFHPSIKAVIGISPPGPMFDLITEKSWQNVDKPMLITTGTWDVEPRFFPDWRLHRMSFDNAPPKDKYALVVDGADHYLGNLICRPEREAKPQHSALAMINALSIAFLDAYLKDNVEATRFLASNNISKITDGFAQLDQR